MNTPSAPIIAPSAPLSKKTIAKLCSAVELMRLADRLAGEMSDAFVEDDDGPDFAMDNTFLVPLRCNLRLFTRVLQAELGSARPHLPERVFSDIAAYANRTDRNQPGAERMYLALELIGRTLDQVIDACQSDDLDELFGVLTGIRAVTQMYFVYLDGPMIAAVDLQSDLSKILAGKPVPFRQLEQYAEVVALVAERPELATLMRVKAKR